MIKTKDYYSNNSNNYIEQTKNCNMTQLYDFFEKHLESGKKLLDIGFGSGRDSLYFLSKGYDVTSIDNCKEFIEHGDKIGLRECIHMDVKNMKYIDRFDAIWASASLLHVEEDSLNSVFKKCSKALKKSGIMYCSFKYGEFNGYRDGRYYVDLTYVGIKKYISGTGLVVIDYLISNDVRENNETKWISFIMRKES